MRSDTRLACNRLPFQTDSSCDRGDVDIHVFDDFPLCSPIDPTPPEAGLPQIDMQVVPIAPPPCACVRVDMSGTGRIRNRKDVRVTGNFKAIGDCCDGNYAANISVDIPCIPFSIKGGDEEKSVTIRQTCGLTEPSGTFNPGVTIDNCTVTIKPVLKLNIPKPKDVDLNPELILTNDCGTNATGTFSITKTQGDCFVNFRPKLQLNIPPTPKLHVCETGVVDIAAGGIGATGSLNMGTTTDACGNTSEVCPTLSLDIPCPVADVGDVKWGANFGWDTGPSHKEITLIKKSDTCNLVTVGGDVDLTLPCPINLTDAKVRASISWSNKPTSEVTVVKSNGACGISGSGGTLDLGLPCPVDIEPVVLRITTKKGAYGTSSVTLLDKNGECGLTGGVKEVTIYTGNNDGGGGGCQLGGVHLLTDSGSSDDILVKTYESGPTADACYRNLRVQRNSDFRLLTIEGEGCSGSETEDLYLMNRKIKFSSAPDSNVKFTISKVDKYGTVNIQMGVYYV